MTGGDPSNVLTFTPPPTSLWGLHLLLLSPHSLREADSSTSTL